MLSFYAIVSVIHVLCKLINEFSAKYFFSPKTYLIVRIDDF